MSSFKRVRKTLSATTPSTATSSHASQPRKGITLPVRGTRAWVNGTKLTSTGNRDLDEIFGGGLIVGSILLIEEDQHTSFHNVIMRAMAAEGIGHQHAVCCVTPHADEKFRDQFLARLPRNATASKEASNLQSKAPEEKSSELLVAWQYQKYLDSEFDANSNLSSKKPSSSSSSASRSRNAGGISIDHDFSKSIDPAQLSANSPLVVSLSPTDFTDDDGVFGARDMSATYVEAATKISEFLRQRNCGATEDSPSNLGRILLHSVGSPMWRTDAGEKSLMQFLHFLKTFIRPTCSNAVCCISVPSFLLSSQSFLRRIEHLCDYIVHLRSFMGDMESPTGESDYGDFDGLLNVRRMSSGNSLVPAKMQHSEFLFKMKRRTMTIERLSLPPETSRSESKPPPSASSAGAATKGSSRSSSKRSGPKVACLPGGRLDRNLEF